MTTSNFFHTKEWKLQYMQQQQHKKNPKDDNF